MRDLAPVLTLYGTAGCHLCERAVEVLRQAATPAWREVDIAADDALLARYGTRIPVVRLEPSGHELGWPFEAADVCALWKDDSGAAARSHPLKQGA